MHDAQAAFLQRCSVLLGIFVQLRGAPAGAARSKAAGREQPNLVALAPAAARFPLLPIGSSGQTRRQPSTPGLDRAVSEHDALHDARFAEGAVFEALFNHM